jgi:hypothetical protein
MRYPTLKALCLCAFALAGSVQAQLGPAGFTGAINSPTADVLDPGTASLAWTNSNPEIKRANAGEGAFGSVNLGFGVLPGLEVVGRLAYEGDLHCNMYAVSPPCSGMRDLSASLKYQFPLRFGWDTRLAFGAVDVGGAATNFRSYYGVATSSFSSADVSLGYGRGNHAYSSLDGFFGSAQLFLTEQWRALAEFDSHDVRAGVRYARPVTEQLALEVGASRKLSNRTDQQAWQAGVGLTLSFDKRNLNRGARKLPTATSAPAAAQTAPPAATTTATPVAVEATLPTARAVPAPAIESLATQAQRADELASRLSKAGFSSVWVGFDEARHWVVQAEPLAWRKNRLDALGMALALWHKSARGDERVRLTLTYLQDPVLSVATTLACLSRFTEGNWWCDGRAALALDNGQSARVPALGWAVAPAQTQRWEALRPQFELGPVMRQHLGNEVGLYDASVGLNLAWEVALGRGLLWQGQVTAPVVHTENFGSDKAYGRERVRGGIENSLLSYQQQMGPRMWVQGSLGYAQHNDFGGQLDVAWLSPEGSLRLSALAGYYAGKDTSGLTSDTVTHPIGLAAARWSAIDGRWMLEAQAGQFYNQDYGVRFASHHWFGDNRLTLYYRDTQFSGSIITDRVKYAGFEISMPIGERAATMVGPATVRGSDQWVYGIGSRVGNSINSLNAGYGVVPVIRHGLLSDTLDYDRAGVSDIMANLYRVRAMLRELAGKP